MTRLPWLALFDVDGTLIQSGRAGARGLNLAFERLYGHVGALDGVPLAGRTDRAIASDLLRAIGREPDEPAIARLREAYCECLAVEIRRPVAEHPTGVLPGVVELLDELEAGPRAALGLLTGNFARGAAIKLGHFDLDRRFRFGAFGDNHLDRRALVPLAIAQARRAGVHVPPPERIVVIGDTPLDVDCARAHGVRAIGVATGPFGADELEQAGADLVVETLAERDRILAWMQ